MKLNLPLHPSKLHPLTGAPLQAVGVLSSGKIVWPLMGGAPDPTPEEKAAADAAAAATAAAEKTAADDAAAAAAAAAAGGKEPPAPTKLEPNDPHYFPAATPVKEMTIAQQAAYWQWNSKKHEDRATEWRNTVGGGTKTAAEVAAELEAQRQAGLSEHQRAIEEAEKRGEQKATTGMSSSMATLAFETAMSHVPLEQRADLIADVNLARVIREDGSIDTDKVASIVARIAPANGKGPADPDFGGGPRGSGNSGSGLSAGASRYREQHAKKTTTTS